jgi:thymidylate kinase
MQDRVRELFGELMQREGAEKEDIVRIDAGRNLKDVQNSVWEAVLKVTARIDAEAPEGAPLRVIEEW